MLRVVLTGGIGSGKTTVSDRLKELGASVIDADEIVHSLYQPGQAVYAEIVRLFGEKVVQANGQLDRSRIGTEVFADSGKRKLLEAILHPPVRDRLMAQSQRAGPPYCVMVIPLAVETGMSQLGDRVLVVEAPEVRRRKWITNRDGLSKEEIDRIMLAQATSAERSSVADDILHNNLDRQHLLNQVDGLHAKYLDLAVPPTP